MMMSLTDPGPSPLPSLPIINPDLPARSSREKYGLLFTFGIVGAGGPGGPGGLVRLPGVDRCATSGPASISCTIKRSPRRNAFRPPLPAEPRSPDGAVQLWDLSLRGDFPTWPAWFWPMGSASTMWPRILRAMSRPSREARIGPAGSAWPWPAPWPTRRRGATPISRERLGELCRTGDPILRLWALYALAVQPRPDPQTVVEIEQVARTAKPEHELAQLLLDAVHSDEPHRLPILDRSHHLEPRASPRNVAGYGRAGRSAREAWSGPELIDRSSRDRWFVRRCANSHR